MMSRTVTSRGDTGRHCAPPSPNSLISGGSRRSGSGLGLPASRPRVNYANVPSPPDGGHAAYSAGMGRVTQRVPSVRVEVAEGGPVRTTSRPDTLAVEEPLEIRVGGTSLSVTMRTPGDDFDLALGLPAHRGPARPSRPTSAS